MIRSVSRLAAIVRSSWRPTQLSLATPPGSATRVPLAGPVVVHRRWSSKSPSDNGDGPSEKSPRRPFQSKLQEEPVADGQEVVDVDLQENKLEKAKRGLKELKEEVEKLEEKRDVAFKASKDTNDTDDKAHYQKQIASAEKQIASVEEGREVQQLLVNAIVEKMTSEVQGIGILDLDNIKEYHPPRDTLVANEYFAYQRDKVLERQVIGCCTQSWDARRKNSNDKGDHKLACLITGSGGGKSRHLKELAGVLKAMDWPDGYEELGARLKNALVFHITFENGTGGMVDSRVFQENATGASHRIGLRMAHQLLPEVDIKLLVDAVTSGSIALRDLHPAQLFERLAKLKGCSVADMTIILCVDAVHEASTLPYTGQVGDKGSPMRLVVSALSSLLTSGGKESNPFCFVCVSATADEAFEPLPSTGTEKEQIIPAPINPSEIFTGELVETDGRLKTVIADMDGHPRALEYLFKVFIKQSNGQGGPQSLDADCDGQTSIEIKEVRNEYWSAWSTVNDVVVDIKGKYEASIRAGEAIFEAVFLGLPVERNQLIRVGPSDVHIQEIIGGGLIRYDVTSKRLSIPFIFLFAVLRAKTEYADFFRDLYYYVDRSEKESISGHELCSAFEMQTALNWHFKTRLFEGQALPWTELHHGALFNDNKEWKKVKVEVKVATEGVVQLRSKFGDRRSKFGDRDTPSMEMIGRRKDEFVELRRRAGAGDGDSVQVAYSDLQNYVVVNGAQASAADVYAWVHLEEDSSVKICSWSIKVTPSTKRSKETYLMERKKAADEPGYFIELAYANASISADDLPDGCGFVGIDNFREYHGPFAARLIHLVDPPK